MLDVAQLAPSRAQIQALHDQMATMPQVEIPTDHTFGPGVYLRTITIPAGVTLVGKAHKTEHIFMVLRGDITLVTDEGRRRVQGPYQVVCQPGVKRAGYAHTETVCVNVHITNETDLDRLEAELIEADALPAPEAPKEIGQ